MSKGRMESVLVSNAYTTSSDLAFISNKLDILITICLAPASTTEFSLHSRRGSKCLSWSTASGEQVTRDSN